MSNMFGKLWAQQEVVMKLARQCQGNADVVCAVALALYGAEIVLFHADVPVDGFFRIVVIYNYQGRFFV